MDATLEDVIVFYKFRQEGMGAGIDESWQPCGKSWPRGWQRKSRTFGSLVNEETNE